MKSVFMEESFVVLELSGWEIQFDKRLAFAQLPQTLKGRITW